jgi:hypothetical protein
VLAHHPGTHGSLLVSRTENCGSPCSHGCTGMLAATRSLFGCKAIFWHADKPVVREAPGVRSTAGCIDHGDFAVTLDGPETTGRPCCVGDRPVLQEEGLAWNMAEFQTRISADHGHNQKKPEIQRESSESRSIKVKARGPSPGCWRQSREHGAGRHGSPGFRIRMTPPGGAMVPAFDSRIGLQEDWGKRLKLAIARSQKTAKGDCVTGMDRDWRLTANGRPPCCAAVGVFRQGCKSSIWWGHLTHWPHWPSRARRKAGRKREVGLPDFSANGTAPCSPLVALGADCAAEPRRDPVGRCGLFQRNGQTL